MTRKRFIKKLRFFKTQLNRQAKALGVENVGRSNKCRVDEYNLPSGMTYKEAWEQLVSICGKEFGIK